MRKLIGFATVYRQ